VAISVGLPVSVNNPVRASQVRFQQFHVIERFCVEGSNKHSDRGHSSNYLEFFTDRKKIQNNYWNFLLTVKKF